MNSEKSGVAPGRIELEDWGRGGSLWLCQNSNCAVTKRCTNAMINVACNLLLANIKEFLLMSFVHISKFYANILQFLSIQGQILLHKPFSLRKENGITVADPGFSKWGGAVLSQMGGAHPVFR